MPDYLITPELVLQVAEAARDYRITPAEFNNIMAVVTSTFLVVAAIGLHIVLTEGITKRFTKETGIKVEEKAGVPIPIMV